MAKSYTMISASLYESQGFATLPEQAERIYTRANLHASQYGIVSGLYGILNMLGYHSGEENALFERGFLFNASELSDEVTVISHWWAMNKPDRGKTNQKDMQEAARFVCATVGGIYLDKNNLPSGYELSGIVYDKDARVSIPGIELAVRSGYEIKPIMSENGEKITGLKEVKINSDCSSSLLRPDFVESESTFTPEENRSEAKRNEFEIKPNKEKRNEEPARVSTCPQCGKPASCYEEITGDMVFDCSECGLLTVNDNGETIAH